MRNFAEPEEKFNPELHVKTFYDLLAEVDEGPLQELGGNLMMHLAEALITSWDSGFQNIYDAKDSYVLMYSRILKGLETPQEFVEGLVHVPPKFSWHIISALYEISELQPLLESVGMKSLVGTIGKHLTEAFEEEVLLSDDELNLNRLTTFELMLAKVLESPVLRDCVDQLVEPMKESANKLGSQLTSSNILTYSRLRAEVVRGLRGARSPEEAREFLESF